jgi:hypothetical protein
MKLGDLITNPEVFDKVVISKGTMDALEHKHTHVPIEESEHVEARKLAEFAMYLRTNNEKVRLSDTRLAYCLADHLGIEFDVANGVVNEALGI